MNRMAIVWRFHFLNCPAFKSKAVCWPFWQFPFALHHSPLRQVTTSQTHSFSLHPGSVGDCLGATFPWATSSVCRTLPVLPFPQQDTYFVCSNCSGKFEDKRTDCAGGISLQGGITGCGNWALPGLTSLTLKGRLFLQLCNLPWSLKLSFPSVKQSWGYREDYLGQWQVALLLGHMKKPRFWSLGPFSREKDQVQRLERWALLQMLELL